MKNHLGAPVPDTRVDTLHSLAELRRPLAENNVEVIRSEASHFELVLQVMSTNEELESGT